LTISVSDIGCGIIGVSPPCVLQGRKAGLCGWVFLWRRPTLLKGGWVLRGPGFGSSLRRYAGLLVTFHRGLCRLSALAVGRLLPVRLSLRSFGGGFITYVSRGAYYTVRDGKTKSRAGIVRIGPICYPSLYVDTNIIYRRKIVKCFRSFLPKLTFFLTSLKKGFTPSKPRRKSFVSQFLSTRLICRISHGNILYIYLIMKMFIKINVDNIYFNICGR
jgi:hypothetical protein